MRCPSRRVVCVGLIIFVLGGITLGGLNTFFNYTNTMNFCTSCHSMQTNFQEYKNSLHYQNVSGVQATCADCHVPKDIIPMFYAKITALQDVYFELVGSIDTLAKFEAKRWQLATKVWERMRANDSRECRSCHSYQSMKLAEQDKRAADKHLRAVQAGKTCIDCHAGLVHEEPLEADNAKNID